MKKIAIFATAAIFAAACSNAPKAVEGVDVEMPTAAQIDSVSYLIGINFGSFIKNYDFGDVNHAEIKKGMNDFLKAEGKMGSEEFNASFKINPDEMNRIFNEYLTMRQNYTAAVNKLEGEKFLEENKTKEGVQVTESGLQYKIIEAGSDVKATSDNDAVHVHYTGKLLDGTVFDESNKEGEPVKLQLNRVIKGWTEGLKLVGEGGKMELYIPSDLAYGERGNRGIKPNSTLIFEIDLVKVEPAEVEEEK